MSTETGQLHKNATKGDYDIVIVTGADAETMAAAKTGPLQNGRLVCPETGNSYAIGDLRGDRRVDGETVYGLRLWENEDLDPRPNDKFQERLYCVRWTKLDGKRLFSAAEKDDLAREAKALQLIRERFDHWQAKGYIPSSPIPRGGDKTEEPIRTRGWTYWHHLFTPRQLLMLGSFTKNAVAPNPSDPLRVGVAAVGVGAAVDNLSRLCGVNPHASKGPGSTNHVFMSPPSLNPQVVIGSRPLNGIRKFLCTDFTDAPLAGKTARSSLRDAREVDERADIWFTDPPYADAINYHELTDYFLAWYERLLPTAFNDWRFQDVGALAVQGSGVDFKHAMVDIYARLARQMPDNGLQLVQFTHQNPGVWGDLGMILWASGLRVAAAWTISTETAIGGLKKGNYVQGTVNLVLRRRTEQRSAWLDEIYALIEDEVKRELDSMTALDDESDPNFGDTDYQLAAYAAALRALTQFSDIENMDIRHELFRERSKGKKTEFEKVIDRAVEIACNYLIPRGFDEFHWKGLMATERLYLKGLELERHREARAGAYQELAKGYGVREYTHLYADAKANQVRFKTAHEFKRQQLGGEGFGTTLTRQVLYAIHETVRADDAREGLNFLKTDGSVDYWGKRKAILALLAYLKPLASVAHMPHWHGDAEAVARLAGAIENDHA